jgi:hypothetical protein
MEKGVGWGVIAMVAHLMKIDKASHRIAVLNVTDTVEDYSHISQHLAERTCCTNLPR